MKIAPLPSASSQITQKTTPSSPTRDRAIAALMQGGPSEQPAVPNQNNISPEEMGAIRPESGQNDTGEDETEVLEATAEDETPVSDQIPAEQEAPKDPALSKQFAQLARQERAYRAKVQQQEQAYEAREAQLKAREAALSAKDQEYRSGYISKDQFKKNPLGVLADTGISYDELTNQLMNQQPTDPRVEATMSRLEAKIAELEADREASKKSQTESQKQQYDAAVKQIESEAKRLVSKDPAFELIQATGSLKDVVDLITQTYEKDGILLSVEEAAQEVEAYLEEESLKISRIQKIQKRLQESASKTSEVKAGKTPASPGTKQPQPMKTLTNQGSTPRQLSAKERAILAFKGELK